MEKIFCVGKNYLKHAIELGDPIPKEPVLFIKPASTVLAVYEDESRQLKLPESGLVHHEIELVFRIEEVDLGHDGRTKGYRLSHFTFGLDLTKRDLQNELKKSGLPWEKAKVFRNATVVGPWSQLNSLNDAMTTPFQVKVNGQVRQSGVGSEMRWQPEELLIEIQNWFPIRAGDLMFTGTPEGVGPLKPGDKVEIQGGPVHYFLDCV